MILNDPSRTIVHPPVCQPDPESHVRSLLAHLLKMCHEQPSIGPSCAMPDVETARYGPHLQLKARRATGRTSPNGTQWSKLLWSIRFSEQTIDWAASTFSFLPPQGLKTYSTPAARHDRSGCHLDSQGLLQLWGCSETAVRCPWHWRSELKIHL